ncbi:hypothetical protein KM043_011639 [Ampulex compressa]|nr:hypothetical protein KM043_011639 [Ampulex compressa]
MYSTSKNRKNKKKKKKKKQPLGETRSCRRENEFLPGKSGWLQPLRGGTASPHPHFAGINPRAHQPSPVSVEVRRCARTLVLARNRAAEPRRERAATVVGKRWRAFP